MKRSYYAIIPANVRYDSTLIDGAKLLYGEITALCNQEGYCWASNLYFSELYGVSKVTISKWINQLKEKGYIDSYISYKEGSKEIDKRYLTIVNDPIKEKFNTPIKEKFKDNTTVFNNTINKKNSRKRVYDESSIHFILAKRLYDRILENNPNHKKPNLQNWANDIRLMMERDKRTQKQIEYVIDWCQQNNFWKSNILSVAKLREKFDQLVIQIKSNKEKVTKKPNYEVKDDERSNEQHTEKSGHVRLFR